MKGRPRNSEGIFWTYVNVLGENDCWIWLKSSKKGYGRFTINYVEQYAHIMAYKLAKGPIERGLEVMHLCNNKLCCNPKHLKLGTTSENTQQAYDDGLIPVGQYHARGKFSSELISLIKKDHRSQTELASIFGVSQSHISRIKRNLSRVRG